MQPGGTVYVLNNDFGKGLIPVHMSCPIHIPLRLAASHTPTPTHPINPERRKTMENYLLISDAAKRVQVESHVLRYWEEELKLPIKRNELGHRYYTDKDIERFVQIKTMKERGLQLKAIKMILKNGKLNVLQNTEEVEEGPILGDLTALEENKEDLTEESESAPGLAIDIVSQRELEEADEVREKEEKAKRLQWLLQQLIRETLQENNKELCREIKDGVVKELDYQFRCQEEREAERDKQREKRSEEYYKKMDELLRKKSVKIKPEKKKRHLSI